MKILINDLVQNSDAPQKLKTPSLADKWIGTSISIDLGSIQLIDCIGVGNTDGTFISINGQVVSYSESGTHRNGLYDISPISTQILTISHNGSFIGRFSAGKSRFIGVAPAREPAFWSTHQSRTTLSGQVISGAGGISGRKIDVDVRYKVDRDIFDDFEKSYPFQTSRGFPFFILFDIESHRFPWSRFYGDIDDSITFQSSVNYFLYSKKFSFTERF